MNIQVSVLIWTIICFCVLMLILSRLLFKPILAFMDERNARIRRAGEKKAHREQEIVEQQAKWKADSEEAIRVAAQQAKAELETAQKDADASVAAAEKLRFSRVNEETAAIEKNNIEMAEKLSGITDDLARSFAERLTIGL